LNRRRRLDRLPENGERVGHINRIENRFSYGVWK